jgi:hypothetical protein
MKLKITAALLACFMLLASLSACGKDKEDPDETKSQIPLLTTTADTEEDPVDPSTSGTASTEEPAQTTEPAATSDTTAASTSTTAATTTAATTTAATTTSAPAEKFTACNDTVYVIASALNVRTSPAITADNVYTQVKSGDALKRTGYNDNWFRIVIEDKEYYISANPEYTSPDDPNAEIEFSARYETVYVTAESLYIRETPHSSGAIYSTLTKGEELLRIGYHETWSKVMYDGKMLYCGSKYLTTENPNAETTPPAVG